VDSKKILLHICCAGCGAYVGQVLHEEGFEVILYFYNPNIHPKEEYELRLKEVTMVAEKYQFNIFSEEYDHDSWLEEVKGLEKEKEKGKRCLVCYEARLKKTVEKAVNEQCGYFASTLSVSPYKLVKEINKIGIKLEEKNKIKFLERNFKKQDGFKRAAALSKELELYRQNYCGCEFSKR